VDFVRQVASKGVVAGQLRHVSPSCAPHAHARELLDLGRMCHRSIRPATRGDVVLASAIRYEWLLLFGSIFVLVIVPRILVAKRTAHRLRAILAVIA
jgi:hypothetical protein